MATVSSSVDNRLKSDVLLFLDCLDSVLQEKVLLVESKRHFDVRRSADVLRECIHGSETLTNTAKVEALIETMMETLRDMIGKCIVRHAISWDKLWTEFHSYRQNVLVGVWEEIGDAMHMCRNRSNTRSIYNRTCFDRVGKKTIATGCAFYRNKQTERIFIC